MPAKNLHISLEPLLNDRLVQSPGGTTSNREFTATNSTATALSPTASATAMWIYNDTTTTFRYGGSGVDGSSGIEFFPKQTLIINNPKDDFLLYFFQSSGGDLVLDVVEFF